MAVSENLYLKRILVILFIFGLVLGFINFPFHCKSKVPMRNFCLNAFSKTISAIGVVLSAVLIFLLCSGSMNTTFDIVLRYAAGIIYAIIIIFLCINNIINANFVRQLVRFFQIVIKDVRILTKNEQYFTLEYASMFKYKFYFYIVQLLEYLIEVSLWDEKVLTTFSFFVATYCFYQFIALQVSNIIILKLLRNMNTYLRETNAGKGHSDEVILDKITKIVRKIFQILNCAQQYFGAYVFCCYLSLAVAYMAVYYFIGGLLCPTNVLSAHIAVCILYVWRYNFNLFDIFFVSTITDKIFIEYQVLVENVVGDFHMNTSNGVNNIAIQYQLLRDVKFINAFGLFRIDRSFTFDYILTVCQYTIMILQYFVGEINIACDKK